MLIRISANVYILSKPRANRLQDLFLIRNYLQFCIDILSDLQYNTVNQTQEG